MNKLGLIKIPIVCISPVMLPETPEDRWCDPRPNHPDKISYCRYVINQIDLESLDPLQLLLR